MGSFRLPSLIWDSIFKNTANWVRDKTGILCSIMGIEGNGKIINKEAFDIASLLSQQLNGLTIKQAKAVIEWLSWSIDNSVSKQSYGNDYFEETLKLSKT